MNICSIGKVYENASVGCWRRSGTSWQPTKLQCVSSTKRLSGATNSRLSLPGAVPLNSSSIVAAPARYRSRIQCITNSVADLASRSLRLRLFTHPQSPVVVRILRREDAVITRGHTYAFDRHKVLISRQPVLPTLGGVRHGNRPSVREITLCLSLRFWRLLSSGSKCEKKQERENCLCRHTRRPSLAADSF